VQSANSPLRELIVTTRENTRFEDFLFFRALRDGSFSKEDFAETQIQFLSAVVFFARPMTALAARIPRPELRINLLRNIADEHGGDELHLSHEATFLAFLDRLGVTRETVAIRTVGPAVRAFNLALWGVCSWDDPWIAVACLGIIEDLFARISAFIGESVIANGWLQADELVHYKTHATLDIEHAGDFYQLLEGPWQESPLQAQRIRDGLVLGTHIFMQLYQGLYQSRTCRESRWVAGAASGADGWTLPGVDFRHG
jgi:pyrroloquinoline quinone (PQQ) biosynthesis protein C